MHPDIKVRRLQTDLRTRAAGYILFAFWDIIEYIVRLVIDPTEYLAIFEEYETNVELIKFITTVVLIITIALITYFHIYIGQNAIAQANGIRKSNFYIIVAIIGLIISVGTAIWVYTLGILQAATVEQIVASIINMTSDAILLGLIIDAIRLRKYEVTTCS